jgi:hypothetical protein
VFGLSEAFGLGNIEQLIRIECPDSNSVNGAQPEWLHVNAFQMG